MLFEARAGVLRTRMWRRKWDDAEEVMCAVCGEEEETAEHIVLRCEQLTPHHPSDTTMAEALGFVAHPPPGDTLGTGDTTDASAAPPGLVTGDVVPNPRFKERRDIVSRVLKDESQSTDEETATAWVQANTGPIVQKYGEKNVLNADETALFYQMLPQKTVLEGRVVSQW
ncbi:hypothetical protein HPB48_009489 [Haemaphysalis longicornis]|uniref:Uncharacterized protein n=1 Tax=Haemaphysalis longicornis TaxID=44386 RepID=A0A9J6GGG6_HAELO|nr:hypothetical protein HPB48_009489 [Haemaphysalis longicornis]